MTLYNYVTIATAILMTILILVQTRGASLGAVFCGGRGVNTARRGADKTIFQMTIILAFVFAASLIVGIVA